MGSRTRIIGQRDAEYPERLRALSDAPKLLYVLGGDLSTLLANPCVAIVGSRKVTAYGRSVTNTFGSELARNGICVASGLAIGVDGLAHRAAVEAGGAAIAVLPCNPETIYPASHRDLAERILQNGGAIVSEYPPGAITYKTNFVARNRIVAALADAVLITEAAMGSGTLHTAQFALEQGKEVLAVPGNITSETSAGTNNLIKVGARPVTCLADVLHALGLEPARKQRRAPKGRTPEQQLILNFLTADIQDGGELLAATGLSAAVFNQNLTMLEITGAIRALGANRWGIV